MNFRALLDIGMLLSESGKARILRSLILDIVLDTVTKKAGGDTKYVNQRDETYLVSLFVGEGYKKDFISALKDCVDMGNYKYPVYTNKIYKSIFKEHAGEYRNILSLAKTENVRETMYAEVLTTISMYETGLGHEIRKRAKELDRKLTSTELFLRSLLLYIKINALPLASSLLYAKKHKRYAKGGHTWAWGLRR